MRVAFTLGGGEKDKKSESANGGQGASMRYDSGAGMYMPHGMPRSGGEYPTGFAAAYTPHYEGEPFGRGGEGENNRHMGFTAPLDTDPEARHRSRRTGRYVRGEMDEDTVARSGGRRREYDAEPGGYERRDEGGMEHLERKLQRLEQRLEESEEAREKLHKKLRELQSDMEDGKRSKGREKRGDKERGKGGKGDDDEDDDEDAGKDDPLGTLRKLLQELPAAKAFLTELPGIFEGLMGVLISPPPTWPAYLAKGDYAGIFAMESKELLNALDQYKSGQKDAAAVCRELKHSGAALVQLYAHLAHNLQDGHKK